MGVWFEFGANERNALLLATFAGLSTSIGGAIAILRRPGDALLAFLLGLAFGVMMLLSVAELWIHSALEHGLIGVTLAVAGGAVLYVVAQPLLPSFEPGHGQSHPLLEGRSHNHAAANSGGSDGTKGDLTHRVSVVGQGDGGARAAAGKDTQFGDNHPSSDKYDKLSLRTGDLLRLSFLMLVTMTSHNLPEGVAVAFSAFSDFGPIMAMAIATHNIPEGIIVAAPIYAATGSKWRALGVATASGLSEPIGALLALVFIKPFVEIHHLYLLLAFVGGVMGAVCMLELLPEGRKCRQDLQLAQGAVLGAIVMGWTLYVGV